MYVFVCVCVRVCACVCVCVLFAVLFECGYAWAQAALCALFAGLKHIRAYSFGIAFLVHGLQVRCCTAAAFESKVRVSVLG